MKLPRSERDYEMINRKVAARFACDHHETIKCKMIKSNIQVEYRHQCQKCGVQVGNAIPYREINPPERGSLPEWSRPCLYGWLTILKIVAFYTLDSTPSLPHKSQHHEQRTAEAIAKADRRNPDERRNQLDA